MTTYRKNVEGSVMADRSMEAAVDDEAPVAKLRSMDCLFVAGLIAEAVGSEVFEEAAHLPLCLK